MGWLQRLVLAILSPSPAPAVGRAPPSLGAPDVRPRRKLLTLFVARALALTLMLPSPLAKADTLGGIMPQMVLYTVGGAGLVVSLHGVIGNSAFLADGERPTWICQMTGYTGAVLLIVGGSFGFVDGDTVPQIVGGAGIALGVAEIVITVLAGLQPEAADPEPPNLPVSASVPSPRYVVSPFIAPTPAGETAFGLTLSVQGF